MRINVYSQELLLFEPRRGTFTAVEAVTETSGSGTVYSAVRMFLYSTEMLHHDAPDDDRSAVTFWLPRSQQRRERLAELFEEMASMVRAAPPETGMD